jgi:hypothetical protein
MSGLPKEQPSTADLVSAGSAPRQDEPQAAMEHPSEDPSKPREPASSRSNVRRMEPVARADADRDRGKEPDERPGALLPAEQAGEFRHRWDAIQTGFVDEPRRAVQDADGLVAQTMKRVAEVFAEERAGLERQWSQGQDVSTEDLRVALKRYRSFFDRLLSV